MKNEYLLGVLCSLVIAMFIVGCSPQEKNIAGEAYVGIPEGIPKATAKEIAKSMPVDKSNQITGNAVLSNYTPLTCPPDSEIELQLWAGTAIDIFPIIAGVCYWNTPECIWLMNITKNEDRYIYLNIPNAKGCTKIVPSKYGGYYAPWYQMNLLFFEVAPIPTTITNVSWGSVKIYKKQTFCGDGICNGQETQITCCQDCGCQANYACVAGSCTNKGTLSVYSNPTNAYLYINGWPWDNSWRTPMSIPLNAGEDFNVLVKKEGYMDNLTVIRLLPGQNLVYNINLVPINNCINECVAGQRTCDPMSAVGYKVCGNYDSDSCYEWSSLIYCTNNTVCSNGNCVIGSYVNITNTTI